MSDTPPIASEATDSAREARRARLDRRADDYDAPGDYVRPSWRAGDREDPRDRGTPALAFIVAIVLVLMVTVALWLVIRQLEQRPSATGAQRVRIEAPSLPMPDAPRLPEGPTLPPTT